MKKRLLFLFGFALTVMMLVSCNNFSDMPAVQPPAETAEQATSEPTGQATPEPTEKILSVAEARVVLTEWFTAQGKASYVPDMNRQEGGVQYYCFSVDYSWVFENHASVPAYAYAYTWVNSITGDMEFQEAGYTEVAGPVLYTNIPDSMFPIQVHNGVAIHYDRFSPPYHELLSIEYAYTSTSVMELYQAQLKEAGFVDHGSVSVPLVDSLWSYDRSSDGARLIVEMFIWGETFSMKMYVNYLNR